MSATLELSRPSRLVDLVWSYQILLDGQPAGEIRNAATTKVEVAAGSHTLQVRSLHVISRLFGLASPTATLVVTDGETITYACVARPFLQSIVWWFKCVVGDRSGWITLAPAHA
jgi:hypothetical protein